MSIITRFAPSPTGFLHIGGARTALFNYLFAKNNGGKFLLRIEDTDQKRSTKEAVDVILKGLKWLAIANDGITYQSKNIREHQKIAKQLLASGKAYYCYTSSAELAELRKKSESKNEVFRFQSPWRDKQPYQNIGIKPVIRIKAPRVGETIIKDLVQGQVKVSNVELDDLVILRSDNTPTYMLAVVVDDHNMQVTHIIRGDDHLINSFKQQIIYQALGWSIPQFAHIPLIYGSDGTKMSKRHGATAVTDYQKNGYLPEAMRNYLLRLGWSHGNEEIISDNNAIKWFNLENIGKSPSRFDFAKLDHLNKHYIKQSSETKLLDLILLKLTSPISAESRSRILKALEFIKIRAVNLNDLARLAIIYSNDYHHQLNGQDLAKIKDKSQLITKLAQTILTINDNDWNHNNIKEIINSYAVTKNLKMKDFGPLLRIILTFSSSSAGGIFDIITILGRKEVARRFALTKFSN